MKRPRPVALAVTLIQTELCEPHVAGAFDYLPNAPVRQPPEERNGNGDLRDPRRSRGTYGLAATGRDERQIRAIRRAAGRSYRLVLTYADASRARNATPDSDIMEARFVDVVPGVRVVQAVDFVSTIRPTLAP